MSQQRQVADDVEYLVAGQLVSEAQAVADRPSGAHHQQVGGGRPAAQSLAAKLHRLGFQQEGTAAGHLGDEPLGSDDLGMALAADRRSRAVVEEVGQP